MTDLRFAIMGTGRIARKVAPLIDAGEGCAVTVVASREESRARAFADGFGFVGACTYEDLLTHPGVDAVYVTLPNVDHPRWSERLLDAGKHVLCEKPLAWTGADAERLYECAARNDRRLVEAFMYLHAVETDEAVRIARDPAGPIGRLERIEASFDICIADSETDNVRYAAALAGGALMDLGCYPISWARTVSGEEIAGFEAECEMVDLYSGDAGGAVDGSARLRGRLASGVEIDLRCSMTRQGITHARLIGTEGVVDVPWFMLPDGLTVGGRARAGEAPAACDRTGSVGLYTRQAEAFARAAAGRSEPCPSPAWSIAQARTIERVHETLRIGMPLAWA